MSKTIIKELNVSSSAFKHGEKIPSKYTFDGDGINPPLETGEIPERTKTLALIVEDPDAIKGTYDHWLVWNIHTLDSIKENSNPGTSGRNSSGKTGYQPPCPPVGLHRYFFHVFALDNKIDLMTGGSKEQLKKALENHILAKGTLVGTYERMGKT